MNIQIFSINTDNRLRSSKPITYEGKFIHTILTFTGAFLFSIILIVLVHEIGHFLAFHWRGYDAVSIRINPFMGTTTCKQDVQMQDAVFIALGGTIFNLSIASISAITLRFTRNTHWILVKMYAAMTFLMEGIVIITGLFFQETVTDFAWLIRLGWSPIFVGFLGIIFVGIGGYLSYEIWIILEITPESSRKRIILLNSPYILYSGLAFFIGQWLLPSEMSFIKSFLAVGMILHWLYLGIRIILAPAILPEIQKRMRGDIPEVTINTSKFSLMLGCASWVLSFLVLN
jgi:hypothetical protein